MLGVHLEDRVALTATERRTLRAASRIAKAARERYVFNDYTDTVLAEIEHGCRDVADGELPLIIHASEAP